MTLNVLLLGGRLRAFRIAKGHTMKECAEKYGISKRYLADLERGKKAPKLDTLVRISNSIKEHHQSICFRTVCCWKKIRRGKYEIYFRRLR